MDTFNSIAFLNDNDMKKMYKLSSHLVIIGDLLRVLGLIFLGRFVLNKNFASFNNFLLTYAISSVIIGFFAYNHGHTARGISELTSAIVFMFFYASKLRLV